MGRTNAKAEGFVVELTPLSTAELQIMEDKIMWRENVKGVALQEIYCRRMGVVRTRNIWNNLLKGLLVSKFELCTRLMLEKKLRNMYHKQHLQRNHYK